MAFTSQVVLVVDDDNSIRKALSRLLKSAGYGVKTFKSAEEFLEHDDGRSGDCLVLDVRMPTISGLELQSRLSEIGRQLPTILITAHHDQRARQQAMRSGAIAFLHKPVEDVVLLAAIHTALQNRNHS